MLELRQRKLERLKELQQKLFPETEPEANEEGMTRLQADCWWGKSTTKIHWIGS